MQENLVMTYTPYMYADVKYHIRSRTNTDTSLSDELTAVKGHPLTFSRAQMKDQSFWRYM